MSWQAICAYLALLLSTSYGCIPKDQLYVTVPQNTTVEKGSSTSFTCIVNPELDSRFYLYAWSYKLHGGNFESFIQGNALGLTLEQGDSVINVPNVMSNFNAALFKCSLDNVLINTTIASLLCNNITETPNVTAYLFVKAAPTISLSSTSHTVSTQETANITVTVEGYPTPELFLYHVPQSGETVLVSDSRVSIPDGVKANEYHIIFRDVRRADQGNYRIVARNGLMPDADEPFSLTVTGVDPPVVEITPSEVVSPYNGDVSLDCSIQTDAYNPATRIEWTFEGTPIFATSSSDDTYITNHRNGTVSLRIQTLLSTSVGMYTCTANNGQTDSKTVSVFGPPPSPLRGNIQFEVNGNSITITWQRPDQSSIIDRYNVTIYSGSTLLSSHLTQFYNGDHTSGSITVSDLDAGEYTFTVTSLASNVLGIEGPAIAFTIEQNSFPIAVVAGAAGGGVAAIVIILIVVIVSIYCCCKCYASRKIIISQQQRWGSDEEKMAGSSQVPAVQNTYIALAVNDNTELPPSPMSPMTSAMGIDPKWEFPRENIALLDQLAVGQFTVLYKGMAKGLRDNRSCDVAIKTLKDGATEDDLKVLIYEMDMLATIDEHPNIVSLLRVCTVGKPVFMVMEYMSHGDLLGFLRSCRGYRGMYAVSPGPRYNPPAVQLTSRDLLNMATKIASGMRFLADRKIVHRALCAKNILVGAGMDVKIYNVGSFDIPVDDTGDGLAKWMAPETLFDGTNTTYSDVWSFGVTMWELVTIGGTPYANVPAEELLMQLQSGMRMPCPPHCAQEVYDIIGACWEKNPQERPHFAIIHENLDELVMSKLSYLDLRNYDNQAYSDFVNSVTTKSTPL